ncbi:LysR family transcriptional regulator [Alteribacter keqinensis]|uniref:LysR family transcriptional regulator n=1 Tax=Alteribacter keqinensis TaxID=2483800 RepID=A0A3M7TVZ0_9BACI|nr:LysR family transcriptional regulator [Alteribacter keqinensis]RNA68565.1 LysR family transcriptional regulator [Alteribacter keqinensis]
MEWQQFIYFQTLARKQHVTRAAEALSISQSALSRSIARFEEEVGVPLFDRQGRSIRLNKYGQMFLSRVDTMLNEYAEGIKDIQNLLDPEQGEVSLGFLHTLSTSHIPDLLASFRASYPGITFKLGQGPSHSLTRQLQEGVFDLCLIVSNERNGAIDWRKLWDEELFVIVPKDHTYASRTFITFDEIADEPFIHLKEGFSLRNTIDRLFQKEGITPEITFEGEEAATVEGLVAAGLGISILPDLKGIDQSKISQIRVKSPECKRTIGLAWVKGRYLTPAAERFKQFILENT